MMQILISAALDAGRIIMKIHAAGADINYKSDDSPVTEADRQAEKIIAAYLTRHFPEIPLVAEEAFSAGQAIPDTDDCFFLVDPLDGTREFISGHKDFTVNIALIRDGAPVAGIVFAPALGELWYGEDSVATKFTVADFRLADAGTQIHTRQQANPPRALISRSHCDRSTRQFLDRRGIDDCLEAGSSLKFCLIAEGKADIYPRFTPTMMWDTAAGDAVLRAAGGMTVDADGKPLSYRISGGDRQALYNPHFIAHGRVAP